MPCVSPKASISVRGCTARRAAAWHAFRIHIRECHSWWKLHRGEAGPRPRTALMCPKEPPISPSPPPTAPSTKLHTLEKTADHKDCSCSICRRSRASPLNTSANCYYVCSIASARKYITLFQNTYEKTVVSAKRTPAIPKSAVTSPRRSYSLVSSVSSTPSSP